MIDSRSIEVLFQRINEQDLEKIGDLLQEDAAFYFPKTQSLTGKERILRFFKILFKQYPTLQFHILRVICEENMAAVHWTNRGMSRHGAPYENEGVTILETDGRQILFMSDFFKDTGKFGLKR